MIPFDVEHAPRREVKSSNATTYCCGSIAVVIGVISVSAISVIAIAALIFVCIDTFAKSNIAGHEVEACNLTLMSTGNSAEAIFLRDGLALSCYRSRVLSASLQNYARCSAEFGRCDYTPPPLKNLPVLSSVTHNRHRAWHEYIDNIYGPKFFDDASTTLDLNEFTWFYWDAPLQEQVQSLHLADINDKLPNVPAGTPWTGGTPAWEWGPEHLTRRMGFFVWRPPSLLANSEYVVNPLKEKILEVFRVGPTDFLMAEKLELGPYFYHTIGSGVFLHLTENQTAEATYFHDCLPDCSYQQTAPRTELRIHLNKMPASDFWPKELQLLTADGHECVNDFNKLEILACKSMVLRIWDAEQDNLLTLKPDIFDLSVNAHINSNFQLSSPASFNSGITT